MNCKTFITTLLCRSQHAAAATAQLASTTPTTTTKTTASIVPRRLAISSLE